MPRRVSIVVSEQFPLEDGLKIAEFVTWTIEAHICKQIESNGKGGHGQVERLSQFSSDLFALSCRLFILQLIHVMETSVNTPRSLHAGCIRALHVILCRLDPSEQPKRDLDVVCNQTLFALTPKWEQYLVHLAQGDMQDKAWEDFDHHTPSAEFVRQRPPPHLRSATKVVPESHRYRLAYCMMLGLETAVRTEDGMRLVHTCVYGFQAFQKELENQMRHLGFEPPYPLNHTLNLDQDLGGTEIELEIANKVLASMVFRYDLPAGGSLVSPKHVLEGQDVWLEDLCPALFSQIRQVSKVEGMEYAWSVAHRGFKFVEFVTNSKSGETFFFSHDGRFIVKTISDEEAEVLVTMLPGYLEHIKTHDSLLMRICGLYRLSSEGTVGREARYFIVCLSVFDCGGLGLHQQYDLKGSLKGRKAAEGQSVLKDMDWMAASAEIALEPREKLRLRDAVAADAKFLEVGAAERSYGVLDYSLLVGVHDRDNSGRKVFCRGVHLLSSIVKARMLPALRTIRMMRHAVSLSTAAAAAAPPHPAAASSGRSADARASSQDDGGVGLHAEAGAAEAAEAAENEAVAGAAEAGAGAGASEVGRARSVRVSSEEMDRAREHHSPLAKFGGGQARHVYFIGIVDFLVPWSFKKKAEFAWNAARGYRKTGSCVPPESYARRMIRFMTDEVFRIRDAGSGVELLDHRQQRAGAGPGTPARAAAAKPSGWMEWVCACFGAAPEERRGGLQQPLILKQDSPTDV